MSLRVDLYYASHLRQLGKPSFLYRPRLGSVALSFENSNPIVILELQSLILPCQCSAARLSGRPSGDWRVRSSPDFGQSGIALPRTLQPDQVSSGWEDLGEAELPLLQLRPCRIWRIRRGDQSIEKQPLQESPRHQSRECSLQ